MSDEDKRLILDDFEFLKAIYNKFSPDKPLPAECGLEFCKSLAFCLLTFLANPHYGSLTVVMTE